MIAIIAAIAVISAITTIAVIAIIAIIGTSVDAENVVLCRESAERKCRKNNTQLSSCTDWSVASGSHEATLTRAACSLKSGPTGARRAGSRP